MTDEADENDEFDALWFWANDEAIMSWFNIIENVDLIVKKTSVYQFNSFFEETRLMIFDIIDL